MYNSAGEVGLMEGGGAVAVVRWGRWLAGPPGFRGTAAGGGERPKLDLNRLRVPSEIKLNE